MSRCVLDFETRSRALLKVVGAIEYAKHESTSVFCLGYKIDEGPCKLWIPERAPMPDDLWHGLQVATLVAHNAGFERAITKYTLTRYDSITERQRSTLLNLEPNRWVCTAAKAAACSLPRSLEEAARALSLKTQKDLYGHKLIQKYSKPRKPSKNNPSHWWTDKKDLRDIYRYCLIDVQAEWELDQALPDLTPFEQRVWAELDQVVNDRGVLIDIPTVKTILSLIREETHNITARVRQLSQDTISSATKRAQVLAWVNARGANMANLQAATIRDKLLEPNLRKDVADMLSLRQAASRTSTAKYTKMLQVVGDDNRARELLLYCGAQVTGRWAGRRLQPHNFPRPTVKNINTDEAIEIIKSQGIEGVRSKYGDTKVMDVLVSVIRGMIIASPGHELYCADFAAVELCIAFWVAEHVEGLIAIREKRKLYEEMASAAFDVPLHLVTKESLERFVGKETVLGAQYGLGWAKHLKNCHQKGVPQVTPEMAKKAIYTYRRVHWPIPEMWSRLETGVIQAIKSPNERFKVSCVEIYMSGKFLCVKLPSGRRLRYFKPRLGYKQLASGRMVPEIRHWGVDSYSKKWMEMKTWGGVIFNNVVQGIARDLMVSGAMNIEKARYKFLLSVHDEALSERKKGCGSLDEYIQLMTKLPRWAEGLPLRAEGWVGPRYHK